MSLCDRPRRDESGFSLVEVVVSMALLLLITSTVYGLFGTSTKQMTLLQGMIEEQSQARLALSGLQSELRNAYAGDETVAKISTMTATGLVFTSADRGTPLKLRRISYNLSGGVLTRAMDTSTNSYPPANNTWTWPSTAATPRAVVGGVVNTTLFVYKDDQGVVTTNPALVQLVEITLVVRDKTAKATQTPETYTTSVRLRGTE